jgi:hypothetical protein
MHIRNAGGILSRLSPRSLRRPSDDGRYVPTLKHKYSQCTRFGPLRAAPDANPPYSYSSPCALGAAGWSYGPRRPSLLFCSISGSDGTSTPAWSVRRRTFTLRQEKTPLPGHSLAASRRTHVLITDVSSRTGRAHAWRPSPSIPRDGAPIWTSAAADASRASAAASPSPPAGSATPQDATRLSRHIAYTSGRASERCRAGGHATAGATTEGAQAEIYTRGRPASGRPEREEEPYMEANRGVLPGTEQWDVASAVLHEA